MDGGCGRIVESEFAMGGGIDFLVVDPFDCSVEAFFVSYVRWRRGWKLGDSWLIGGVGEW